VGRTWWLLAILVVQGFIGYTQYFTGLPEALVALHVLGACLVWIAVLRIPFALRTRGPKRVDA
jgi:cytochrome c oxidase assembly protein subunit 15